MDIKSVQGRNVKRDRGLKGISRGTRAFDADLHRTCAEPCKRLEMQG